MARGVNTAIDSLDFFVQARDVTTAVITVTATATSTQNSPDQVNTLHKGATLFLNMVSVAATTTVGLNIQGKDPVSGNYATIARASLDAQATNAVSTNALIIYPGVTAQASLGSVGSAVNIALPMTWRVQASITATASQGGAGASFTIGVSKIL